MGWTYKAKKWRDQVRQEYTEQTGSNDFQDPAFEEWLLKNGYLDPEVT